MSMQTWAEKEIEIACKREREDSGVENDGDWDYGCACYESALKAYKSLMGDDHSGFSINMTKHILNRLIDGKPLTPIEDTPDVWNDISDRNDEEGYVCYQYKRIGDIIHEMFPISMPYMPEEPIKVYCFYLVKPDSEKAMDINRFFKESKDGWDEIDEYEYNKRKAIKL